ncbi:type VI secretion system tube protein Hcp [Pseudomonas sp. MWU13-2100]|uniref:type VI secretion system tube protein Hcp n=1 Tax=Pseudomonas sp. MWU13-2100 TaxID=2935075 RepID=UPI002010715C|nr:type VI secretion system tube protein Hcp [Pseudomonas sp. MWU13-2100]
MILLKFGVKDEPTIKGNSEEAGHKFWIVVDTWQFGGGRSITMDNDRENSVGQVSELVLSKPADIVSPLLFIESVTGKSLEQATLHVIQTNGSSTGQNKPYIELKLKDPMICAYNVSGSSERPMEQFTISFTEIEYTYDHIINGQSAGPNTRAFSQHRKTTV